MKKRRHHYVCKDYLNAWAVNGKVWCRMEEEVFNSNPVNIVQERDFVRWARNKLFAI